MKNGWTKKQLRDVTTKIGSGATPLGGETAYKSEGISLIRSLNVHDWGFRTKDLAFIDAKQAEQLDNVIVEAGDVLLNITGASVARCCIVPDELLPARVNQHVSILRTKKDQLLPKLLHYMLIAKDYKERLLNAGEGGGSTRQALTKAQLQEFLIEYPNSLPEQQRIVGILDEAFDGIATAKANAEKNLRNARGLFESHLHTAFAHRGPHVPLSDLATDITDGDHLPPPKTPTGVPFITISDIVKKTREIDFSNTFTVPKEYFQKLKPNKKPRLGDVLYTVTGATLGIPVLVKQKIDFCFQRHIGIIRPKPDTDSMWLSYALLSPQVFRQATVGSTGTAQKTVSLAVLRKIKVPRITLSAQRTIAAKIDAISEKTQRLESLYQRKLAALDELKKSLLHRAFSGEL
jgi:type I restriction enzyme S subunit